MMIYAFIDAGDGYYQVEVPEGQPMPAWTAGLTPTDVRPITISPPQVVTMRQARLALLGAGLLAQVDAAIDALPEPQRSAARIEWDYSSEVHRSRAFVQQLGAALGLNNQQLDALFTQAAAL